MSHSGRCFRDWRRTKARKIRQGKTWSRPIRQKVPLALRPFLFGEGNQRHATGDTLANAIARYVQHQNAIGKVNQHAARGR